MEYIYSAMLLHKAGKKITGPALTKLLEAAGVKPDTGRIKALVATLKDVDIDEAIRAVPVAAAAPAASAPTKEKPKAKEKPEEEEKPEEVTGLGALFG